MFVVNKLILPIVLYMYHRVVEYRDSAPPPPSILLAPTYTKAFPSGLQESVL